MSTDFQRRAGTPTFSADKSSFNDINANFKSESSFNGDRVNGFTLNRVKAAFAPLGRYIRVTNHSCFVLKDAEKCRPNVPQFPVRQKH